MKAKRLTIFQYTDWRHSPNFMKHKTKLTTEQYEEYFRDIEKGDFKVRKWCNIPDNKYYTITTWPENLRGDVFIIENSHRNPPLKKISKSDQI